MQARFVLDDLSSMVEGAKLEIRDGMHAEARRAHVLMCGVAGMVGWHATALNVKVVSLVRSLLNRCS